jgi:tetrahydromethanopterin S-methyltransferase subunit F
MYIMITKAVENIPGEGGLISKIKKLKEDSLSTYNAIMGAGVILALLLIAVFGSMIFYTFPWITSFDI